MQLMHYMHQLKTVYCSKVCDTSYRGRVYRYPDFLIKDTLDKYNKGDRVVINKHADLKDVEMLEKRGVIVEQKKQPLIPQQEHTRLDFKNHDVVECFKMYVNHDKITCDHFYLVIPVYFQIYIYLCI